MKSKTNTPVLIRISADSGVKKEHNLYAYVIDQNGKIIESAPFDGLEAKLKSSKSTLDGPGRIYVGVQVPKVLAQKADERTLIKGGAYQVIKNFNAGVIDITRIPASALRPWHPGNCLITGTISNTITLDGRQVSEPVCNARVHLVEVEVLLIYRYRPILYKTIPDWVINEIKQRFKSLQPAPPIPDPIGPIALREKINLPLSSLGQINNADEMAKIKTLAPLPSHVLQGMTADSYDVIRKTIIEHHQILYPYFCLWPFYWYWIYETDEDNITYTNCDGRFEYWENTATEDGPLNIYVWVEVEINGQWVAVYRPFGIPCYTWWNYVCNTPINIQLTDSRIAPCVCDPLEGSIVWVKKIGTGTSVRNLALHAAEIDKPSLFVDARGLTNSAGVEGSSWVSPFTRSFPITVQFGDGFPSASAKYFRWKYRRIADADLNSLTPGFTYQDGSLSKSYTYQVPAAGGGFVFHIGQFPLDVVVGSGKAYKIPNVDASVDTGIATAKWDQDTTSINIMTTDNVIPADNFQNGIYEFILELLDSAGNVQDVADDVFQIDSYLASPPFEASTPARAVDSNYAQLDIRIVGGILKSSVNGFRFLIRIDNGKTSCSIGNAEVLNGDGTTATTDSSCGFAEFKDKLSGSILLKFNASQPHRFARYSFGVIRGNGNVISAADVTGQVPEPHNIVSTPWGPIDYQVKPSIFDMLDNCPRGAFSENVYVTAYHTDGSIRIQGYDSNSQAAFAIEPQQ